MLKGWDSPAVLCSVMQCWSNFGTTSIYSVFCTVHVCKVCSEAGCCMSNRQVYGNLHACNAQCQPEVPANSLVFRQAVNGTEWLVQIKCGITSLAV